MQTGAVHPPKPVRLRPAGISFSRSLKCTLAAAGVVFCISSAYAQFTQQGNKLVPNNEIAPSGFGSAVSVSADGNTAIAGAFGDNSNTGAAWIYTRSGGVWTQGQKLVGNFSFDAQQGYSVAMSADGNTAIIGGPLDFGGNGAAWVFIRNGGTWQQQGPKLTANDALGPSLQGASVALSGDGNTAIIGGFGDNSFTGAAWVFTRNNGFWTQQGPKLVGRRAAGPAEQGFSVAISADGNTAVIGGPLDNFEIGAAWVFTRSNGTWSQQGRKLIASDATGLIGPQLGISVALSGDGNTALVGGWLDGDGAGAGWIFKPSNGQWLQQGPKLVGTGATAGGAEQGWSVALSSRGDTAALGGIADNSGAGAVWVFSFKTGYWIQVGSKLVGTGASSAQQGSSTALSATGGTLLFGGPFDASNAGAVWAFMQPAAVTHDFDGNSKSDVLWRNVFGDATIWFMNGGQIVSGASLGNIPTAWSVIGTGDFDGDGHSDILWRNNVGDVAIWFMNGGQVVSGASLGNVATGWTVVGTGDFDGDGKTDILWRNTAGDLTIWFMNGGQIVSAGAFGKVDTAWTVAGVGDLDCDGRADIIWRNTGGDVALWFLDGPSIVAGVGLGNVPTTWTIAGVRDFNADGYADLLWRDTSGNLAMWLMDGPFVSPQSIGSVAAIWSIAQITDFNGDRKADILWRNGNGDLVMWLMNGAQMQASVGIGTVPAAWTVQGLNAN